MYFSAFNTVETNCSLSVGNGRMNSNLDSDVIYISKELSVCVDKAYSVAAKFGNFEGRKSLDAVCLCRCRDFVHVFKAIRVRIEITIIPVLFSFPLLHFLPENFFKLNEGKFGIRRKAG